MIPFESLNFRFKSEKKWKISFAVKHVHIFVAMIDMQTPNATWKLSRLENAPTNLQQQKVARNFVYWNIRILIGNTITMVDGGIGNRKSL